MTSKSLALFAPFGHGYSGDEAIPCALNDLAQDLGLELDTHLVTCLEHPNLSEDITLLDKDKERRQALKGMPALLTGSGTIDPSKQCSLIHFASYLKAQGSEVTLFGGTIDTGSYYSPLMALRIRRALAKVKRLYVRDEVEAMILKRLAVGRSVEIIGDPLFGLKSDGTLPESMKELKTYVVVSLAPHWSWEPGWLPWISAGLTQIAKHLAAPIVFAPLDPSDIAEHQRASDYIHSADESIETIVLGETLPPRQLATVFNQAAFAVTMRLHGTVLAYAQQTPFLALLHHPKVWAFARTMGCEDYVVPQLELAPKNVRDFGFAFADLPLHGVNFLNAANDALKNISFERLEPFKAKQREILGEILGYHAEKQPVVAAPSNPNA